MFVWQPQGRFRILLLVLGLGMESGLTAAPSLPPIFGDHMVLQCGLTVQVWGKARPGEKIEVGLGDAGAATKADGGGNWRILLKAMAPGGPLEMTVRGDTVVKFHDVLLGEVWLASGQSNMEYPLEKAMGGPAAARGELNTSIRFFTAPQPDNTSASVTARGRWEVCSPRVAGGFSAVAYYFGERIAASTRRPVGLIGAYVGGSLIESWMPEPGFAGWMQNKLGWPVEPAISRPSGLFETMIAPLSPYGLRGVLWYQGESSPSKEHYAAQLAGMIRSWRRIWRIGEFHFLVVQLPNYYLPEYESGTSSWAVLREAQWRAVSAVPNAALVVALDQGDAGDIHPKDKHEIGRRLALLALNKVYGQDVVGSGPEPASIGTQDGHVILSFSGTGSGLVAKGGVVVGFETAGKDTRFFPCPARIVGPSVVVLGGMFPNPAYVRYAWANDPEFNLYNREGFPAGPFFLQLPGGHSVYPYILAVLAIWALLAAAILFYARYRARKIWKGNDAPLKD